MYQVTFKLDYGEADYNIHLVDFPVLFSGPLVTSNLVNTCTRERVGKGKVLTKMEMPNRPGHSKSKLLA